MANFACNHHHGLKIIVLNKSYVLTMPHYPCERHQVWCKFKSKKIAEEKQVKKKEKKKLKKQKKMDTGNMLQHESSKPVDDEQIVVSTFQ